MEHRVRIGSPGAALRRLLASAALGLLATAALSVQAQPYRWTTIAGGQVGDGLPATNAVIADPVGIAIDADGSLYVSQWRENRIRKVSPGGAVIETIAGDGTIGFAGDGGPASLARLKAPAGLAIDAAGNLYVADGGNHRVRKITPAGVITTVAGNGTVGYSGDGGKATSAAMMEPYGLAFDAAGNLYVSDWMAHVVRKIAPNGIITTVAGTGVAGFSGDGGAAVAAQLNLPEGLSVDASGNLYIADVQNHRIRRVTPGGTITTVAGNGEATSAGDGLPATQASIFYPYSVVVAPDGALIITDSACALRRVVAGVIDTFAGDYGCMFGGDGGPALQAGMGAVEGIAFDAAGNLVLADFESGRVRRIQHGTGTIDTIAGHGTFDGDGGFAVNAVLSYLRGITVDPQGVIHVTDAISNRRVRSIDPSTGLIWTTAGTGTWGSPNWYGMPAIESDLNVPKGLATLSDGTLLLADRGMNFVYAIDQGGYMFPFAGNGTAAYGGDGGAATQTGMDPYAVAADDVGNVYIADYLNHRVRKVTNGVITTVAGTGAAGFDGDGGPATAAQVYYPDELAIDTDGGLLIADNSNRVRKIRADGTIVTVAGNGGSVDSGDGGPATAASLENITGIGVSPDGSLYIATGSALRRVTDGVIHAMPDFVYGATDIAFDAEGAPLVTTESGRVLRGEAILSVPPHDFNGDGHSDVFWRESRTGANAIWRSANSASQQGVTGVTNLAWEVAGSGDFDGDGTSDLFWRERNTGANAIWKGANSATPRAVAGVTNVDWQVVGIADFDADGQSDLLWRNRRTGANTIWRSANPAGSVAVTGVTNLAWVVAGTGDYDGDGHADILWHNVQTGAGVVWKAGHSGAQLALVQVTNRDWRIVASGDFDGDGRDDVVWRNARTGANAIWRSGNAATPQPMTGVTNLDWAIVAAGDYDADGRSDVLWRNGRTGANVIWRSGNAATSVAVTGVTNIAWQIID